MAKLPFIQFYPKDWLMDTRKLSAEARGIWIDILCYAWNEERRGVYVRRRDQMFRELGITEDAWDDRLVLEIAEVAKVEELDLDLITIMSRRMVKEEKVREIDRNRQSRFRSNATVTPKSKTVTVEKSEVILQKSEVITTNTPPPPKGAFDTIWDQYPRRENKKAAIRHFNASVKTMQDWLDIQNALANFKKKLVRESVEPRFIPHGGTWFNNWRDYVSYQGVDPVRAPNPPPKKVEVLPPDLTQNDLDEMHRATIEKLGGCRTKDCEICERNAYWTHAAKVSG